jgi:hypothetical protein
VQRTGPSTGVPTKTEQGDRNQALGASQVDFSRIIMAPTSIADCLTTPALAFNLADRYQCPVMILSDLLLGESNETVDPAVLDVDVPSDRGALITEAPTGRGSAADEPSLRYKVTESGISPRAVPGVPGHLFVAASDEHDEDGVLISDVYTDTARRKKMVDKRARKMAAVTAELPAPTLSGPADAEITLVGWGSTWGVLSEAADRLNHDQPSAHQVSGPDERNGHEDEDHAARQPRGDAQSACAGARERVRVCRARVQRPARHFATLRDSVPGLRPDRWVQPVRGVQQAEHIRLVPQTRVQARRRPPRSNGFPRRHGCCAGMG